MRGHLFNNGKPAANAGLGLRYLGSSRIWGINGYYDYRNTNHQHYNQVSLGLETLGKIWDFRLNGYLPVGKTASGLYDLMFSYFQENFAYLSKKQEFAMKGANAEAACHVDHFKNVPLTFAAGPYYLEGKGKIAWGGQVRAVIDIYDYCRIEGNASYDNVFKWIGQGQLSFIIPLGRKRTVTSRKSLCSDTLALSRRSIQRVDRNEIIPVDTRKVDFPAIDPATGQPWFFWFVNNTSHSAGTYESPFNTLLAAQNASSINQVIYVYPGDGTTNGMSEGITLQNNQQLLGASISNSLNTTLGTITIPPMASGLPNITNTTGAGNVVTLANNNTIAGFNITAAVNDGSGIYGSGTSNTITYENAFSTLADITTNGIYLLNPSGQADVSASTFTGFNNTGDGTNNGNGIYIELGAENLSALTVTNNTFTNLSNPEGQLAGNGILVVSDSSGAVTNLTASNNTFDQFTASASAISNVGLITNLNFTSNTCSNFDSSTAIGNIGTITNLNFTSNTCSNFGDGSEGVINYYGGGNFAGAITTLNATGNTFVNFDASSYGMGNAQTMCTITTLNSMENTFDGFSNASFGIFNIYADSAISTLNSTGDVFLNIDSNSGGIGTFHGAVITTLNVVEDTFNTFSGSSSGIMNDQYTPIITLSVTGSSFENFSNSTGINYILPSGTATAQITNNTFSGTSMLSTGFASSTTVNGGTLCLEFTNNTATPTSAPDPYQFVQTGGTFNRTTGSDSTTNIGTIATSGTINASGSCTE